jgi:hypothetical protein
MVLQKPESAENKAARVAAENLERVLNAAHQGHMVHCNLDNAGSLQVQMRDSSGNVSSQPLMIGNVWDALAQRGIEIQPGASEVVRFRIGEELEVAATVKLQVGFFGGRTLLLPSIDVRWLSLEERVAEWHAFLVERIDSDAVRHTLLRVSYQDSNYQDIHEDEIDVGDVLAKSGIELRPKGSAVIRFALGADLMEATVELEVGLLGFRRKFKLVSVERKRGEAWRVGTPEEERP